MNSGNNVEASWRELLKRIESESAAPSDAVLFQVKMEKELKQFEYCAKKTKLLASLLTFYDIQDTGSLTLRTEPLNAEDLQNLIDGLGRCGKTTAEDVIKLSSLDAEEPSGIGFSMRTNLSRFVHNAAQLLWHKATLSGGKDVFKDIALNRITRGMAIQENNLTALENLIKMQYSVAYEGYEEWRTNLSSLLSRPEFLATSMIRSK